MLKSYFELYFKLGNGIPKFDNINNAWIYSSYPIINGDLFNQVDIDYPSNKPDFSIKFYSRKKYFKNSIIFTRYPFTRIDLHKFKLLKFIVLFREPYDWMISYYVHHEKKKFFTKNRINEKIIRHSLLRLKNYYEFWIKFSENNKKKVFFLDYNKLTGKSLKSFTEICKFFHFSVSNKKIISDSVKYNSKKYSLKNIKFKFEGTRFTNKVERKKIQKKISKKVFKEIKLLELDKIYKVLIKKVNI